ncbi:hypothetical protein D9619_004172 [Psilocybe cf. subviscida]|uniref:Uncharacterized protein n=1 Tax=Psilocybe cf. subviscida TaxID=2480587 RepID=A0A8H5BR54_9AGAR|nr:hypothetical protein D9619_004172 [Psilocybe cf. subviscida]
MPLETGNSLQSTIDTPASEPRSVYFDAPLAIFRNSTPTIEEDSTPPHQQQSTSNMTELNTLPPPVHSSYPAFSAEQPSNEPAPISSPEHATQFPQAQPAPPSRLVQHPNGSEGWLPTEEPSHHNLTRTLPHAPGSVLKSPQQPYDANREAVVVTNLNTLATRDHPAAAETAANTTYNAAPADTYAGGAGMGPGVPTHSVNGVGEYGGQGTGYALNDPGVQPKDTTTSFAIDRSASHRSAANTLGSQSVHAFAGGAGATGPPPDFEGDMRVRQAGATLTPKERKRINEEELQHKRRLSKLIKSEAKTEKRAMANAFTELEALHHKQKGAIKAEEQLVALSQKQGGALAKAKDALLKAQMRFDTLTAEHSSTQKTLARVRGDAMEITGQMQSKSAEVENLRRTLELDERERGVRLGSLSRRT